MSPSSLPRTKATVVADFRRAQILDAARLSFAAHGLRGATVDHIAKRARVAKGTVYLYYRSKEHILSDVLAEGIKGLYAETVPPISEPAAINAKLTRFFGSTLAYFDRHRDFFYLCQSELDPEVRQRAGQQLKAVYAAQTRAWELVLKAPRAAASSRRAHLAATMIVSLAFGLASQRVRGWIDGPIDDDVMAASALAWKGIGR